MKLRLELKGEEQKVVNLTNELQGRIDEVKRLKTEMGNLMALNEELLQTKKGEYEEEESYRIKFEKLKLDSVQTEKEFHACNTERKEISLQCTWERQEKEKVRKELAELKLVHQEELKEIRKIQRSVTQVESIPEYKALKKETDLLCRTFHQTRSNLEESRSQIDRLRTAMWAQDRSSLPSYSFFRAYELQRNILLTMLNLERGSQLDGAGFDRVWRVAGKHASQHNLVCEMIARGDFN